MSENALPAAHGAPSGAPDATDAAIAAAHATRLRLRPKEARFVELFIATGNASAAVRAAGYSERSSNTRARDLMRRPRIREAIQATRDELAQRTAYTLEKLVADLDGAMEHARATENSSALVRAIEIKAKATGILVDRPAMAVQVNGGSVNIGESIMERLARADSRTTS